MEQLSKLGVLWAGEALTATQSANSASVDCKEAGIAEVTLFAHDASNDTESQPTALNLQESDNNSSWSTISGAEGDEDFDIPASTTDSYWGVKFLVDMRGRKRYLRLQITAAESQTYTAIAELRDMGEQPNTAAEANVDARVIL